MLKLSAMCNLLSGFVKRKVLGAKGKVKNERQWTGFTGLTGLDSRDLGGLSDWLSDSLGAGGLRDTNTKTMCLFHVAAGASREASSASQSAQSEGLTLNPKFIRGIRVPKELELELNPNFICEICGPTDVDFNRKLSARFACHYILTLRR